MLGFTDPENRPRNPRKRLPKPNNAGTSEEPPGEPPEKPEEPVPRAKLCRNKQPISSGAQ